MKNEIEKEEKVEVEPVQEVKPDVVEIEYKDNKEEVEVSHVPKPSKVKEPEQEKTRSVISETIETVPLKKEIQPSFEVYENTTFTLESAKPKKPVMSTPTEQPQYQPQQPTYQPIPQQQITPQVTEQRFYYLYDDDGNLIAALPKK